VPRLSPTRVCVPRRLGEIGVRYCLGPVGGIVAGGVDVAGGAGRAVGSPIGRLVLAFQSAV